MILSDTNYEFGSRAQPTTELYAGEKQPPCPSRS